MGAILPEWSESNEGLQAMAGRLAAADGPADDVGTWPEALWSIVVEAGASRWAVPATAGAVECDRVTLLERMPGWPGKPDGRIHPLAARRERPPAACRRRPARCPTMAGRHRRGPCVHDGGHLAIDHLAPAWSAALVARETAPGAYRLDGVMPWVTAAERADVLVAGAVLEGGDGRQLLIAVPADRPGLSVRPFPLAALQASCTSEVVCDAVQVADSDLLAGPAIDVMVQSGVAGTGGLETSALALGQAHAALGAGRRSPAPSRPGRACGRPRRRWQEAWSALVAAALDTPGPLPRPRSEARPTPWSCGSPRPI